MPAITHLITGGLPREDREVAEAYAATVAEANDAQLAEWAAYHRDRIDRAFANGGHPRAHVLLLSIVEDEQDRRYYEDASTL